MTETNNELTDFQKKVFSEYRTVKALNETSDKINKGRGNRYKSCLFSPVFMFTEWFVGKIAGGERRKKKL